MNEVLMAFFFALIAQEIVEAVLPGGPFHSWRRWMSRWSPPPVVLPAPDWCTSPTSG